MTIRIGINGFGRMGRLTLRAAWGNPDIAFVRINDPGGDAATNLLGEHTGVPALQSSLDAAFKVGGVVVDELAKNWPRYADAVPGR